MFARRRCQSTKHFLVGALALCLCAMLPGCFSQRATVTISYSPLSPTIDGTVASPWCPTINEIVVFEAVAESGATIYEWNWMFGDGGTASGQRVWHVFRSVNREDSGVVPWKVTVTAVDDRGNLCSAAVQVQVQPHTGHLASYARREVGLACTNLGRREPEIPPDSRVISIGDSPLEEHWQLLTGQPAFLLLKLYKVPIEIKEVKCEWVFYALAEDGTGWPDLYAASAGEAKLNFEPVLLDCEDVPGQCWVPPAEWYYGYIGFPVEIGADELELRPGWYLVFASVFSVDTAKPDRNVYSFRIYVEGAAGEE